MGDEPKNQPISNPLPQVNVNEVVPKRFRSWLYAAGAVVGLGVWLASEITVIWAPEYANEIMQTTNRILAATTILTGGTGAVYRPSSF